MKNKILLTTAMALIGLFTFSTTAEAQRGRGGRGNNIVWQNSQCGIGWGHNNFINNRMCMHMRNTWRRGRFGNGFIRCNHRGCGMFGNSFRNGRFFNRRGVAIFVRGGNRFGNFNRGAHRGHGRYNRGGGRGNGRFNQGGGRGNGRFNQGGGRGNGRLNQGGGRGNGRLNQGGGRGNGRGNGDGRGRNGRGR